MDMVKDILKEELEYALEVQRHYQVNLKAFPVGNLSKKKINGKEYIYWQYREGSKVKSKSLGKLSEEEIKGYEEKIIKREHYKRLLEEVEQKIKYLRKALNVRE